MRIISFLLPVVFLAIVPVSLQLRVQLVSLSSSLWTETVGTGAHASDDESSLQVGSTIFDEKSTFTCSIYPEGPLLHLPRYKTPSFIIAGAQKAGTTALYALLSQVPFLQASKGFEVHFFDFQKAIQFETLTPHRFCKLYRDYLDEWEDNDTNQSLIFFEKTPAYFASPRAVANMRHFFHDRLGQSVKIIITLRDPVQRAYSWYKMRYFKKHKSGTEVPPFEDLVAQSIEDLRREPWIIAPPYDINRTTHYGSDEFNILPHQNNTLEYMEFLHRGFYAKQLEFWFQAFPRTNFKIIQYEKFSESTQEYLNDILDFVGLPSFNFSSLNEDHSHVNQDRQKSPLEIPPLLHHTREYLEHFYQPANNQLAELLGEEWKDAWKYDISY